jgi:hypothetical protein
MFLVSAISLSLLTGGCWASKEETATQLQKHVESYRQVKVTPGNAAVVLKGADLLLSKSKENRFSNTISLDQQRVVSQARLLALKIVGCTDSLNKWKSDNPMNEWKPWKPDKGGKKSSSELARQATLLKEISSCSELVAPLDSAQKTEIDKRIKLTSEAEKVSLEKEKAEKAAAEKAARDAELAEREKRMAVCREVNQILGRPAPTWESCLEQEDNRRIGGEIMERGREAERERQIRYNRHEAFKECDRNPHALFCDRR